MPSWRAGDKLNSTLHTNNHLEGKMMNDAHSVATLLAQGGHYIDPQTGAIIPPIHTSTTYARDDTYELIGYGYSRRDNPTYAPVENVLAQLEGAAEALVFASGLAGIATFFESTRVGDHIVAPQTMYHGTREWLQRLEERHGVDVTLFEASAPGALSAAVRPGETTIVWIEPSVNPTWDVIDVRAAATVAHSAGAILGVDATATPAVTLRALDLGADVVFHSGTKYLAGHSDVTAGVLATRVVDERWKDVKLARSMMGGILGPFESWLLFRGMRTLHLRYERQAANALAIAQHFETHPKLQAVLYPGLQSHPGHAIAKQQMTNGFGAMLSFLVNGNEETTRKVATKTRLFVPATSLGGIESLIEHRASVEGPNNKVPKNLLRISVGIENVDELIADLEQALDI